MTTYFNKKSVLIILFLAFFLSCSEERKVRPHYELADEIMQIGLDELDLDVKYKFKQLNPQLKGDAKLRGTYLQAQVEKIEDTYVISLDPHVSDYKLIEMMSHELIHIKQMEDGYLKYARKDKVVVWYGVSYKLKYHDYSKRPWEVEAYRKQRTFKWRIKHLLEHNE